MTPVPVRYPCNSLVSFHYYRRQDIGAYHRAGLRLIGDCGAFSAMMQGTPIDIDEFAEWALRWRDALAWVASLDVIGDADASWRNFQRLRARGLDVVPTVHLGAPTSALDRYVAEGCDYVGLGGLVTTASRTSTLRWAVSMFKHVRDNYPHVRFHGWAATRSWLVNQLPFYSVDSSSGNSALRYGTSKLWNPATCQPVSIDMNGVDSHRHALLLRKHYQVEPADVAVSNPGSKRALLRLSVVSTQYREDWLRARFQVTPPTYGLNGPQPIGPNVHFVDSAHTNLALIGRDAA